MQYSVLSVPHADHKLHLTCKRAGKIQEDARDLAFWVLTFFPPYGASLILGQDANIGEASYLLIPLLAIQVPALL